MLLLILALFSSSLVYVNFFSNSVYSKISVSHSDLQTTLSNLQVAERKRRPDYQRDKFGIAWDDGTDNIYGNNGCSTREDILHRDLKQQETIVKGGCEHVVVSGLLADPYSGTQVIFSKKKANLVQIDHIVPLAYAWDMGASNWTAEKRLKFANDPNNLIAVSGSFNKAKSDFGLGSWLPVNSKFLCVYIWQFLQVVTTYNLNLDTGSADTINHYARICFAIYN